MHVYSYVSASHSSSSSSDEPLPTVEAITALTTHLTTHYFLPLKPLLPLLHTLKEEYRRNLISDEPPASVPAVKAVTAFTTHFTTGLSAESDLGRATGVFSECLL
jgi:hypothetical protein